MAEDPEIELTGGNISSVVRVGDTVRRSTGPWTPAVHALLRFLEAHHFDGAPHALGTDPRGREILSYMSGDVFPYPMPESVWTDDTLRDVALLIRRYHDIVASFQPPAHARWQTMVGAPVHGPIICHNDLAPYNTVFREKGPVGFIDWDLASPGDRLYDIAYAVWYWIPLHDTNTVPLGSQSRRLRLFCDAYGLEGEERRDLLPMIEYRQEVVRRTLVTWGEAGKPGWAEQLRSGHLQDKLDSRDWLQRHRRELEHALVEAR